MPLENRPQNLALLTADAGAKDDRSGRLAARERLIRDVDGLQLAVAEDSLVKPVRDDFVETVETSSEPEMAH